jgi:hypothetical protein
VQGRPSGPSVADLEDAGFGLVDVWEREFCVLKVLRTKQLELARHGAADEGVGKWVQFWRT